MFKHTIERKNAVRFLRWINETGGIDVYRSANLSNPGAIWYTPKGEGRPSWQSESTPFDVITDPDEIGVTDYEEVKRFHVAVRRGAQGLTVKLTDASTARLRKAVDKAGDGATYQFDFSTQDAVILKPKEVVSLGSLAAGFSALDKSI